MMPPLALRDAAFAYYAAELLRHAIDAAAAAAAMLLRYFATRRCFSLRIDVTPRRRYCCHAKALTMLPPAFEELRRAA